MRRRGVVGGAELPGEGEGVREVGEVTRGPSWLHVNLVGEFACQPPAPWERVGLRTNFATCCKYLKNLRLKSATDKLTSGAGLPLFGPGLSAAPLPCPEPIMFISGIN